jgi:predicted SAM-dependent methyltransferase
MPIGTPQSHTTPAGKAGALNEYLRTHPTSPVKLHLGCGGMRWQDFVNIDLYPTDGSTPDSSRSGCVADVFADIRHLGLPDASVDEMFSAHTIEHFVRWEAIAMLEDWYRMLKPGGRLVLETPDFWRCVLWLAHPLGRRRQAARSQFYGNQWDRLDFETHRYVWTARELARTLKEVGFSRVRTTHRTETHYPGRDVRAEAIK